MYNLYVTPKHLGIKLSKTLKKFYIAPKYVPEFVQYLLINEQSATLTLPTLEKTMFEVSRLDDDTVALKDPNTGKVVELKNDKAKVLVDKVVSSGYYDTKLMLMKVSECRGEKLMEQKERLLRLRGQVTDYDHLFEVLLERFKNKKWRKVECFSGNRYVNLKRKRASKNENENSENSEK